MTAALLERPEVDSSVESETRVQMRAFRDALKSYFHAISVMGDVEDLTFTDSLLPEVDFVFRVPAERVRAVNDQILELSFGIRQQYGVQFSTIVLPKLEQAQGS